LGQGKNIDIATAEYDFVTAFNSLLAGYVAANSGMVYRFVEVVNDIAG